MNRDLPIDDIYAAAADEQDWRALSRALFSCLGADAGTLRFRDADGRSENVFELSKPAEARYTDYYLHIDPIRSALSKIRPGSQGSATVLAVEDLLDAESYRRSEFYRDFAKPQGQEHMLLGLVGDRDNTVIGFFREGMAFSAEERAALSRLLPHLRRGLQLRQRVHQSESDARLGYAAFEALPGSAVVVDIDCNVLFANSSASRCLSRRSLPISIAKLSIGEPARLVVDNRSEAFRLLTMVRDAAHGGSGGGMRLEFEAPNGDRVGQLAVLVSPLLADVPCRETFASGRVPVLVVVTELSHPRVARPSLLSELFGLSAAEGAVAAAVLGGQTAETVARERDVSLDTVRTQIRTILRKTDAANLRDFERIGALLGAFSR